MRINEVLSTTWSQIDTEAGTVRVGESKTDAGSGRTIPLDKLLVRRLTTLRAEHYAIQMQRRGWNPNSLAFGNSAGNRNSYRNLQKRVLTPLLKELGLPHLTWHHQTISHIRNIFVILIRRCS
jgi:integrase